MTASPEDPRRELRRAARARRNALPDNYRQQAQLQFARMLSRHPHLQAGKHIGVYQAWGSEADLTRVIAMARRRGCHLYLPVITDYRRQQMCFAAYPVDAVMRRNRYGIEEVDLRHHPRIERRRLDTILVPLVAMDERGTRLGSGAGFYDRYLRHRLLAGQWQRPQLIGVGFECQRVTQIPAGCWDVPMDALLTENALYRVRRP